MNQSNENILTYLVEFIKDLFKYWYLVAISLVIIVGGSVVYLKYAAKTYKVTASVVLNLERSNAFGANSDDIMRVNELIEQDKNLQNEIFFMQSSPLIKSVVDEMDLKVSYFRQEDKIPRDMEFSMENLYNEAPFIVVPEQEHLQPVDLYFYIKIIDEENYMLYASSDEARIIDFRDQSVVVQRTRFYLSGTYSFGQEVEHTFASFRILLNSNYSSELYQGKDLFFKFNEAATMAQQFKRGFRVEASAMDATMIEMTFLCDHVDLGERFVNELINQYIENNLEQKNFLATKTIEHLDFQLADISESLGTSEQELQNIRRRSSVMNIDEKAGNLYNQLQDAQAQKDEIERRKGYLLQMEEYFESDKDSTGFLAPSAMGLEDPLLAGLIEQVTSLNSERQQIINNNQLRNPRLRTLEISINNMKDAIIENLSYSINTANAELRDVNRRISELNREFASLPYTQRRLLGIERKFDLSENVYMSLLEQRIQAQIIKASTLPDCKIIEPPQFESVHSPKKMIVLFGALFLGFLIPSVFVMVRRVFSVKVQNRDELRKISRLPQVGSIPVSRGEINVITGQPNSPVAEAFHTLRSNTIYHLMGKLNQVILVTSTMEGEGKSFSALNIASSLAVTNNKTLLLEFDLRRPSDLYSKLGIRGLVGVSSYLINKATLEEITISSEIDNLNFILAGQIPPNPIELISSKKTEELFSELRKRYDYVVIDTPPYGVLTDSFVLMKYADIKLYLVRLGYANKKLLQSCMEDIESKQIDNVQMVINGDNPKQGSYGKYYTTEPKKVKLMRRTGTD